MWNESIVYLTFLCNLVVSKIIGSRNTASIVMSWTFIFLLVPPVVLVMWIPWRIHGVKPMEMLLNMVMIVAVTAIVEVSVAQVPAQAIVISR